MATAAPTIRTVTLDKLTPDPDQVRKNFDKASIATLAANLKARGVLVPLLVRQSGKKLVIVDGERRYRAAKVAKLKAVPVIVAESADDVQRSLDQVAMNSLREPLKPLELGRLLVSLRKDHKLSDNEIAAHLDKQGIPALSKGQMKELIGLTSLPKWAQDMVDAGEIPANAASAINFAAREPAILKEVQKDLAADIRMGGKVDGRGVEWAVSQAYRDSGQPDLTRTSEYQNDPVRFNPAVACKGCEHLRAIGQTKVCMNRKHYEELQAAAKEAGLLAGGKKLSPQEKGAETRAGNEQAERKAESRQASKVEKLTKLVQTRVQQHLVATHLKTNEPLRESLVYWLAAKQPDGAKFGRQWFTDGAGHLIKHAVEASPLKSLLATVQASLGQLQALQVGLAGAAVGEMSWCQVQALAHHLKVEISEAFTVDGDYLALQSLDQLKELGRLGGVEGANRMTGKALRTSILEFPEVIAKLGVPADVVQLYSDMPEPEPEEELGSCDDDEAETCEHGTPVDEPCDACEDDQDVDAEPSDEEDDEEAQAA